MTVAICKSCIHEQVCEDFGVDTYEVENCDRYAVKCKGCKYAIENQAVFGIVDYKCNFHGISGLDADDYCSYSKKKDGDDNGQKQI